MKNSLFLCSEDDLIQISISVEDTNNFEVISSFTFWKNMLIIYISEFLNWELWSDKRYVVVGIWWHRKTKTEIGLWCFIFLTWYCVQIFFYCSQKNLLHSCLIINMLTITEKWCLWIFLPQLTEIQNCLLVVWSSKMCTVIRCCSKCFHFSYLSITEFYIECYLTAFAIEAFL